MISIIGTTTDDILYFKVKMEKVEEVTLQGKYKAFKGEIFHEEVILVATGPSLIDAAIITSLIIDKYDPYMVFNIGSVYSFSDQLRQGDILIVDRYYYADVDFTDNKQASYGQIPGHEQYFVADTDLNSKVEKNAYMMTNRYVQRGFLLSGSSFHFSPNKISSIVSDHYLVQAESMRAYDTTSASIAMVCHDNHVALLSLKAVAMQMGKEREKITYKRVALEIMPTIGRIITRFLISRNEEVNG